MTPTRSSARRLRLVVASLALGAALAPSAAAHTRSLSHSSWQLDDTGARVTLRIPRLELTRLGLDAPPGGSPEASAAARYLAEHLLLESASGPCGVASGPEQRPADEGWAKFRWRIACPPGEAPTALRSRILLAVAPSHLHFARLGGERIVERVLTEATPVWPLAASGGDDGTGAPASAGGSIGAYVVLGIEHIVTGWDHLAFVFALLLLATRLGEVARLVTGFTLAHSVTLALAVLGWVHPIAGAVEAVIGFSVALVAAENGWTLGGRPLAVPIAALAVLAGVGLASALGAAELPGLVCAGLALFTACHFALLGRGGPEARIRAALAFAFGLVHGFGFAGILSEMALPKDRLVPALFGFNVGVELGQLAVVALAWPALRLLARRAPRLHRGALELGSAAICGIGLYWFVVRSFGVG